MILDFEPGDKVFNPKNKGWGIGQVQSIIEGKVNCTLLSAIFLEWSLDIQEENFAVNKLG